MNAQRIAAIAMILSILIGLLGCTPRVLVTPNPGPRCKGIRYYRPKPYLRVVPAIVPSGKDTSEVFPNLVTISLEYLPDFSEEYAIDVRSGFGIANVSIELEDGWNLTAISQELDSQTDENISAAADLVKAIGGVIPTASGQTDSGHSFTVSATDVPLGYYEAVIGCGAHGKKQLYGFRYLGFLPYQPCPTVMGGSIQQCCNDGITTLYGLTFQDGRMVFRPMLDMLAASAAPNTDSDTVTAGEVVETIHIAPPRDLRSIYEDEQQRTSLAGNLETSLLSQLRKDYPEVSSVSAIWNDANTSPKLRITIRTNDILTEREVTSQAASFVASIANGQFLYDIVTEKS